MAQASYSYQMPSDKENTPAAQEDLLNQLIRRFKGMRPNVGKKIKDGEIHSMERQMNFLKAEFEELDYLLKMNGEGLHALREEQTKSRLAETVEEMQDVELMSRNFVSQSKELDFAINYANKIFLELRSEIIGLNSNEKVVASELRLRNLEDKLETTNKKLSTVMTENALHRDQIVVNLKNRDIFNKEFNGTVQKLFNGKIYLKIVLDEVDQVSSDREVLIERLQSLSVQGHRDQKRDIKLMQGYSQTLDDLYSLYNFLRVKGTKRITNEAENTRKAIAKDLFETNQKIGELDKLLTDVLDERSMKEKRDSEQVEKFVKLGEKMAMVQDNVARLNKEIDSCDETLNETFNEIYEIFETCSLPIAPLLIFLGNKKVGVTRYNVKWYLRCISEAVLELMSLAYQITGRKKVRSYGPELLQLKKPMDDDKASDTETKSTYDKSTVASDTESKAKTEHKKKKGKKEEDKGKQKGKKEKSPTKKPKEKKKKEPKLHITEPKLYNPHSPPGEDLVTYVPCVYCTEDYIFSRVEEQLAVPWSKDDVVTMLQTEPYNTPYDISTYTIPGEAHTARFVSMEY